MMPYSHEADRLNHADDWLRCRQGVRFPILPPTTTAARRYFFQEIRKYTADAASSGKHKIDYLSFARAWNQSADGKDRFYVTTEVLSAYARTWEKSNNIRASQDLASDTIYTINQTRAVFAAPDMPFPTFLTGNATSAQPQKAVRDLGRSQSMPPSISTDLPLSRSTLLAPLVTSPQAFETITADTQGDFDLGLEDDPGFNEGIIEE